MFIVWPEFDDTPLPFLSIATVHKHVQENQKDYPIAVKEVKENMYVDYIFTGAPEDGRAARRGLIFAVSF